MRRLLLVPPTLFGITIIVFIITRLVPGGPLERAIMEAQQFNADGAGGGRAPGQELALSEEQLQQLKEYYGFDKPPLVSYFNWLGKVVQGDLGTSYRYNEPVWDVIKQRFPVTFYYGLVVLVLTYTICIPLGILKALRHRSAIDSITSLFVFAGYAVPGYALGAILMLFFAAQLNWFPMSNAASYNYYELSFFGKVWDLIRHATLPIICYLVGTIALITLLMKNTLMDNLAADYVRTAVAKGVSFKQAVWRHALRNSLIPIATSFGQYMVALVTGSFLIESIFDIDGFGLLGLTAIFDRDYPTVMGVILIASLLLLIGNIISDILVAIVDPRIRFK